MARSVMKLQSVIPSTINATFVNNSLYQSTSGNCDHRNDLKNSVLSTIPKLNEEIEKYEKRRIKSLVSENKLENMKMEGDSLKAIFPNKNNFVLILETQEESFGVYSRDCVHKQNCSKQGFFLTSHSYMSGYDECVWKLEGNRL